jgi:hypothetical protein
LDAVGAIPTTGLTRGRLPADPKNPAFPNVKIPPSEATNQYEEFGGAGEQVGLAAGVLPPAGSSVRHGVGGEMLVSNVRSARYIGRKPEDIYPIVVPYQAANAVTGCPEGRV